MDYKLFIESRFKIVNKQGEFIDFKLNKIQERFLTEKSSDAICLKARQQGFSSLITAMFTADFILKEHSHSVIVADIEDNATGLLDKTKRYIESYETCTGQKVPLKYNSRYELYNPFMDSRMTIGTAKNAEFGRSKTITNLHCSEVAFFPNIEKIIAGAGQAVVHGGRKIFETTANGFNEFRKFYYAAKEGKIGYKALFYKASDYYAKEFLEGKRNELGRLFEQEYPETDTEAFITSGDPYFSKEALAYYLGSVKNVQKI